MGSFSLEVWKMKTRLYQCCVIKLAHKISYQITFLVPFCCVVPVLVMLNSFEI